MDEVPMKLGTLIDYVDDAKGDALDKVEAAYRIAGVLDEQADHLIGHFVDQARRSGASWTEIGARMGGVSKQAARKRFTDDEPASMESMKEKAFGRYTLPARRAIVAAEAAAREHEHDYIGTEHILLALLSQQDTLATAAIAACGADPAALRDAVVGRLGETGHPNPVHIPFTAKSKKALELTLREALRLGHNYVGTEHLLLGLIAEGSGLAAEILREHDLSTERVQPEILRMLEEVMARRTNDA